MSDDKFSWDHAGPKEIGDLLDTVSDKIPKMLSGVINSVYSPEAASDLGKAVGTFYKELAASGIPADQALEMTREYMASISEIARNVNMNSKE